VTSLPVAIYIRDACWVFEIDLDPRRLPAAPPSALPSEIVIGDTGDGLGDAAAAIASVLRTAGSSAAAVRFVGVIDDFIALSASGAYSSGALPRHARQPSPGRTGRHRAHA
jgi:acetyl esterase/lipase